jgi:aryl-alcohol dehydrogenase-like predicted oxidoreductase
VKYQLIIDEFGGWGLQQDLLEFLHAIAGKHDASIAAIATRWVLDRDPVGGVIIGARSEAHLHDNLGVFEISLDRDDHEQIDAILACAEGPEGEPFQLERDPGGRHSAIMWTDLNSRKQSR